MTGASGRLGRALLAALRSSGAAVLPWSRPAYDLDDPGAAGRLVERDGPALVLHAAAWTDVDACARSPATATRRNAEAVGELATAVASRGARLVLISTNEVFDGARSDGRGYREDDPAAPRNAYGASKLAGEEVAREAFARAGAADRLWTVRTAWLFGPPGADFPARILAAADRLPAGQALRVVADEIGSPTYAPDLARAILALVRAVPAGTYHLVNRGRASRFEWARRAIGVCRKGRPAVEPITLAEYRRDSVPPRWAVLDGSLAARHGIVLRPWEDAFAAYLAELCPVHPPPAPVAMPVP